ncbi:DUF4267 domain-containing protein [Glycomyces algeriensis]|uniref:Membrane protein n=1 Tax=Glycomyces algeriensis TaxID=256037 RepID=A0A9W6GCT4_9ACTN|nr:DUF4267 domain-containing protein [Glycomyces algeriensis]MDA1368300.1 DUF4267 domain-containing protein [Glycomyces algeriensis]MDR7351741.1 hypothetical protein [Glycomyces algeriensis]GLI44467.1 membrane protein [Glycomyces algeriensis]
MLATTAIVLAWLVGVAVVAMGVNNLLRPQVLAGFGIPGTQADDPVLRAWLAVKAGRDIGSGLMLVVAVALGTTTLAGWVMLAAVVMPVCDTLVVLRAKGPRAAAYGVHCSTAAAMAVIGVLLLLA